MTDEQFKFAITTIQATFFELIRVNKEQFDAVLGYFTGLEDSKIEAERKLDELALANAQDNKKRLFEVLEKSGAPEAFGKAINNIAETFSYKEKKVTEDDLDEEDFD